MKKNGVPFDTEMSMVTLGVRLGTLAAASRGFGTIEIRLVGQHIWEVLDGLASHPTDNSQVEKCVRAQIDELCARFPIYTK